MMKFKVLIFSITMVVALPLHAGFSDELRKAGQKLKDLSNELKQNSSSQSTNEKSGSGVNYLSDSNGYEYDYKKININSSNVFSTTLIARKYLHKVAFSDVPSVDLKGFYSAFNISYKDPECMKGDYIGISLLDDVSVLENYSKNWEIDNRKAGDVYRSRVMSGRIARKYKYPHLSDEELAQVNEIIVALDSTFYHKFRGDINLTCFGHGQTRCEKNIESATFRTDSSNRITSIKIRRAFDPTTPFNRDAVYSQLTSKLGGQKGIKRVDSNSYWYKGTASKNFAFKFSANEKGTILDVTLQCKPDDLERDVSLANNVYERLISALEEVNAMRAREATVNIQL